MGQTNIIRDVLICSFILIRILLISDEIQTRKKVKVTDAPLRSLRIQEQGNRVAVGDENGSVTLLKLSEALSHVSNISERFYVYFQHSSYLVLVTKRREVGM